MYKPKPAAKHLEPCEITDCRFNHDRVFNDDMDAKVCCFGLRHEGCIYFNHGMQHRLKLLASVEARLAVAKYGGDHIGLHEPVTNRLTTHQMNTISQVLIISLNRHWKILAKLQRKYITLCMKVTNTPTVTDQ